jgi:hypothetical protein
VEEAAAHFTTRWQWGGRFFGRVIRSDQVVAVRLGLHATIEHALNCMIQRRSWQSLLFHNRRLSRKAAVGLSETRR